MSESKKYTLVELVKEFADFQPDEQFLSLDGKAFVNAMAEPPPEFVIPFIQERMDRGSDRKTAIRDLYAFLLDKRYFSRNNLLILLLMYFAAGLLFRMRSLRSPLSPMKRVRLYLNINYPPVTR